MCSNEPIAYTLDTLRSVIINTIYKRRIRFERDKTRKKTYDIYIKSYNHSSKKVEY